MGTEFKYDAFISYRHTELDKFVAENLHKQLESFRLPKSIAKRRPGQKNKIERVFRDKEELPLTSNLEDPILQALNNSEWLIVICSPRLRESMWCKKEIETFVKLRGRERVLAVLIEGEPADSFPDELLFKTEKHTLPDGTVEEIQVPVEPLAADVRGKDKKAVLKAMKTEILRLLAAMFQLNYDDLRQRHKEQRMRRIVTASLIGGAACLAFGVYSTATALRIQKQKEQIEVQAEEIKAQSEEIQKQNDELSLRQARSLAELATGYLEDGNRADAIATAMEALTESDGIALPYTPEAQMILTESVRAYDTGNTHRAEYQYETAGRVDSVKISQDQDTICIYDDTNTLTLFDLAKREEIKVFGAGEYEMYGAYGCTFLGKDKFAYVNPEDAVCIFDLTKKEIVATLNPPQASELFTDRDGKYLAVEQWNRTWVIYDGETFEELGTTPKIESGLYIKGPYISSDGILACAYPVEGEVLDETYELYFMDISTMEILSTYPMGKAEVKDLEVRDGVAYLTYGEYAKHYVSSDAYAAAIDIASGKLLWKYEQKGYWPRGVRLPFAEGAKDMLFYTDATANLLNMQTGELSAIHTLSSEVVSAYTYSNMTSFLLYCENGEMVSVGEDYEQLMDISYMFECKSQLNEEILHSPHGLTVLARNDNKITVYTKAAGPDVKETDVVPEYPETVEEKEEILGNKASEIVSSYGLDRPEFVRSVYYSEDQKYCFIEYWDYDFVIYDVEAKTICHTIEDAYPTEWCVGTDADGYTYLLGYYGCYMLNADMVPVMWIPEAKEIDLENQKVYLSWYDHYYEAPIYHVEDLLTMAESYGVE